MTRDDEAQFEIETSLFRPIAGEACLEHLSKAYRDGLPFPERDDATHDGNSPIRTVAPKPGFRARFFRAALPGGSAARRTDTNARMIRDIPEIKLVRKN